MSWDWFARLDELRRAGRTGVIVTVSQVQGSAPREVGAKMLWFKGGFAGTIGGGRLELLALEEAARVANDGRARTVRYPLGAAAGQCCGGVVELLFEPFAAGPEVFLFGAGHVSQALCRTLVDTAFRVHLCDERPEWLGAAALPPAVARHDDWELLIDDTAWDAERSYAVVMTHRHALDENILAALLRRPLRYRGLIGSRSKWTRFRDRLRARGFTDEALATVHCPVGLPVGGKAPPEVAISIAAELLSVHYGREQAFALPSPASLRRPIVADGNR